MRDAAFTQFPHEVLHSVRELREHQDFLVRVRLRQQGVQGVQFRVVFRFPLPGGGQDVQQRAGVLPQGRGELTREQFRADPAEAFLEGRFVHAVHLCGAGAVGGLGQVQGVQGLIRVGGRFGGRGGLAVGAEQGALVVVPFVQQFGVLRADRQGFPVLQGVQEDVIPQDVAFQGLHEGRPAAFEAFEQVGAREPDQALPGTAQVVQHFLLGPFRLAAGLVSNEVPQSVAGQGQPPHSVHDVRGVQAGVHVGGIAFIHGERDGAGAAHREVRPLPVTERQVAAAVGRVLFGVVGLHERTGAAHEVQAHQVAPVVRVGALLERGDAAHGGLVLRAEVRFPRLADQFLGADTQVGVLGHEQPQLRAQILVTLVVRRGRQQNDLALVKGHVLLNGAVTFPLAVAQVVALVNQDQLVVLLFRQPLRDAADRQDLRQQGVPVNVVLPHGHQVHRADDQRPDRRGLLHHPHQGRGHQRLTQADHVPQHHAAPLVQVVRCDLHGGRLVREQDLLQVLRNPEFTHPGAGLAGQVVGHLQVDVVRLVPLLARPALVDDLREFQGDIDGPAVRPAVLEPLRELLRGVGVNHVHVQLTLPFQAREGQVAAAHVRHARRGVIRPVQEVQLGVQQEAQEQLDLHLPFFQLSAQAAQARLVTVRRGPQHQLLPERFRHAPPEPLGLLVVQSVGPLQQTQRGAQLPFRQILHPHQQAGAGVPLPRPLIGQVINELPATQIEVPHAEVRAQRRTH